MVISRRDIRHKWSQYIKWCPHTDCLLQLHVRLNLIKWHMSRSFHHHLNVFFPRTFRQLSQTNQLLDLANITRICKASRTTSISKRDCHIILPADLQNFIIIFVKWIFFSGHTHPCKHKGTSTRNNIHFPFMLFDLLNRLSRNSTMKRHKIHTILRMKPDDIDKIFCAQC